MAGKPLPDPIPLKIQFPTSPRNIGSARIRGIELSHTQQYTFLPGALRGLGSIANFTYIETKGDYGSTTAVRRLPSLTPRSANAGLTWRGYGLDLRLMMVLGNWILRGLGLGGVKGRGGGKIKAPACRQAGPP